ncbi:MAG TPA: MFS transporter, partial [Candidatus Acidoferrales bacterium]|nr:MFS transporter [Candidatus Acidoferrales bacterium]
LSADGKKLLATRILRTFAYGYLATSLGLFLDRLGLSATEIGVVFTAAIAGSALMTVFWSIMADRVGRRRTVATMALLMALGGIVFAVTSSFAVLILAAFTGTISATSSEVGVFQTVEQAILPQTAPNEKRTWLFSIYNTIATLAGAVGSLFAASVGFFASLGLAGADAYRPLFVLYAVVGIVNFLIFITLSDRVELAKVEGDRRFIGIHRSTGTVAKLSALFGIDAFAGGLVVQSIVAYWFYLRWGLAISDLALIFFAVGIVSGLSLLAAGWLAQRFGLLNTMVFTHLPSNVLLMLVPLAPTPGLAVAAFLLRMSVSQMDVPTRQSYTMAVVDPDERTATAGITNVARTTASALSPTVSGLAFSAAALSAPFFIAGVMKIAYDGLIYLAFRNVHPPEEAEARRQREAARTAAVGTRS